MGVSVVLLESVIRATRCPLLAKQPKPHFPFASIIIVSGLEKWDTILGYLRKTRGLPSARGISPRVLFS